MGIKNERGMRHGARLPTDTRQNSQEYWGRIEKRIKHKWVGATGEWGDLYPRERETLSKC